VGLEHQLAYLAGAHPMVGTLAMKVTVGKVFMVVSLWCIT
jgi:hypothetical protein